MSRGRRFQLTNSATVSACLSLARHPDWAGENALDEFGLARSIGFGKDRLELAAHRSEFDAVVVRRLLRGSAINQTFEYSGLGVGQAENPLEQLLWGFEGLIRVNQIDGCPRTGNQIVRYLATTHRQARYYTLEGRFARGAW